MGGLPFRDWNEGAEARRAELLRQRREEMAMLPPEYRRVYVRRVARAASGMTATAGAAVIVMASLSEAVRGIVQGFVPGPRPAVLSTVLLVTLIATPLAHFVARAVAEELYARSLLRSVRPSGHVFADIDRLARVPPHTVAREMAEHVEHASTLWPMFAVILLGPMLIVVGSMVQRAGHFPDPARIDLHLISVTTASFPAYLMLGAGAWVFAAFRRGEDGGPVTVRPLRALAWAASGLVVCLLGAFETWYGTWPVILGFAFCAFALLVILAAWRLSHERAALSDWAS